MAVPLPEKGGGLMACMSHECGVCGHMWFNNSSAWSCEKCGSGRVSSFYDEEGMEYMELESDSEQEEEE